MLNVTTFWKEMFPAFCSSMRVLYTNFGLLPVGRPRTKGFWDVRAWDLIRSDHCYQLGIMFRKRAKLTDDVPGDILRGRGRVRTYDHFHGGFLVR